jgi:hypothetical protein
MTQHNTCGTCDTTWTGLAPCHCGACHHTFSGISLFDLHRRGSVCADPSELLVGGDALRLIGGVWRAPAMDETTWTDAAS